MANPHKVITVTIMPSLSASMKKGSEQLQGFNGGSKHANTGSWISLYANLLLLNTGNINFIGIFGG